MSQLAKTIRRGKVRFLTALLLTFGVAAVFSSTETFGQTASLNPVSSQVTLPSPQQRLNRTAYWLSRRGLQFGVPPEGYNKAVTQMKRSAAPAVAAWNPIGPMPMNGALPNFGGPIAGATFDATGRVTAIAADPTTPGRLFVGAPNGGIWMSNDGGTTFSPISDALPTQAIGAITLDAVNTTPPTIYVATGEGNIGGDNYYGYVLFKSTDLGGTWIPLSPGTFDSAAFTKLAIDTSHNPPVLFAAATPFALSAGRADPDFFEGNLTKGGLWRSLDGGITWTQYGPPVFNCQVATNAPCPAQDVVIDPQNPNHVCVSIEFDNTFCSDDGGNTWTGASFPGIPPGLGHMDRQNLAVGPPSPGAPMACSGGTQPCGILYATVGSINSQAYVGFFQSIDGGANWTAKSVPSWPNPNGTTIDGTAGTNFSQEGYDQVLLVSPTDPQTVIFGGVGVYETVNGGTSWSFLAQNGGTHSDQHALAVASDNDTVYIGNDGGVYMFTLSGISGGVATFTSLNATLSAGQIQGIGPHPTKDNTLLAGFQDNGTDLYTGTVNWTQPETGDGGFALFSPASPNMAFHTFSAGGPNVLLGDSTDGGATWTDVVAQLGFFGDPSSGFYPPLAADPTNGQRLLLGGHGMYVLDFSTLTISLQSPQILTGCLNSSCSLQDIEFASTNQAWALSMQSGLAPFKLFNTIEANLNSGALWTDVTPNLPLNPAASQATGIAVDPNNSNKAVLSISGFTAATGIPHLFKTADFGATWSRADGAGGPSPLPDIPVLRALVDKTDPTGNTIYVASDIGVFQSLDGGATWAAFNLGTLPAVPVFDIEQNNNGTIFIGTHGRGAYKLMVTP